MKKVCLILLLFSAFVSFSQEDIIEDKHEIKTNIFNLIVFKAPEFTYEYIVDAESSLGVSFMINLETIGSDNFIDGPFYYETFALTPYYRRYISKKYASRFFLEAFGMLNAQGDFQYNFSNDVGSDVYTGQTSTNFAFGVAIGSKFVSQSGFIFEFYGGIGRNIYTSDNSISFEFVPRLGVSLGYRFKKRS